MKRGTKGAILVTVALTGLVGIGLRSLLLEIDTMMFVPRPQDKTKMAVALRERFGPQVQLLEVPVVNRDINGFAGLVRGGPAKGMVRSDGHTFSFERLSNRNVCLMTREPWELKKLRETFLARFREAP